MGTFNASLQGQCFRIVKGIQYVSEKGFAYKASETERRAFEGDAEINNKQAWQIVFSESLESSESEFWGGFAGASANEAIVVHPKIVRKRKKNAPVPGCKGRRSSTEVSTCGMV